MESQQNVMAFQSQDSAIRSGTPLQGSGSVGAAPADTISAGVGKQFIRFFLNNTHVTQNILVSFDGGTTFLTLAAESTYYRDCLVPTVVVKGSAPATTYEYDSDIVDA